MINPLIFRAYDVRGIAHLPVSDKTPDLTPESMLLFGKASGTYFKRHVGTNLVLGHDCRLSAPDLVPAFLEGLLSTGCDVTEIGMVPSPFVYFASCYFNFDGGVSITASHNPKEYNGFKLVGKNAHSICGNELQDVLKLAQAEDFEVGKGSHKTLDVFAEYIEKVRSMVKLQRPLKIVVDAGNGATGPYLKSFYESLGCEVIALFEEPDGAFPNHEANPEEHENMEALIKAVLEHGADIGLGFDGDGDRIGVVDDKGKHYSADLFFLTLVQDLLKRQPGAKIVFDVKVSQILINGIKQAGGEPVMCKTGHSLIERKMHEIGSPLGGEISGHIFFAENYYGFDDAMLAGAKILEVLSKSAHPFSQTMHELGETACTPELKSPCPDSEKFRVVEAITKNLTSQYDCITIDGVRVNFDENSWGAVRSSNTSPNLTIRFEAPNETRLKEIIQLMLVELEKYPEIDLWWKKNYV